MRLHRHPSSIFPRRVRIALREKNLECDEALVDLPGGALKTDAFLALYQSVAILEYLEERYRRPPLMPESLRDRALARQWMQCSGDYTTPPFKRWLRPFSAPAEPHDSEDKRRAALEIGAHLDVLERALGDHDFLAGGFSLADICYVPFVCELDTLGLSELLPLARGSAHGAIAITAGRNPPAIGTMQNKNSGADIVMLRVYDTAQ